MRSFRLLKADEIECRAQQVKENGLVLLLYKTARTDAQLLDETFGPFNWQCDYKVIDGSLYCGIGIRKEGSSDWIWKWNCGSESNMEAEKGRASDALKRSGFTLGLGTELYSAPFIFIPSSKANIYKKTIKGEEKYFCNDDFEVASIGYDKNEKICQLTITVKGQVVWSFGQEAEPVCEKCGKPIRPYEANGRQVTVKKHIAGSVDRFGKIFCIDCINESKNN